MLSKLLISMMIAYPVVAYIALWLQQSTFLIIYLLAIFFLFAVQKCTNKNWFTAASLFLFVGIMSYLIQQSFVQYLIYLPPILILFGLFVMFTQSLSAGQIPLITRYAILLNNNDEIGKRHYRYTRLLTVIWSIFFLSMAMISLSLAIFSSLETWSLFTNVISYILITAFFVIEFFIRKRLFSDIHSLNGGFFQFIRKIIKLRPNSMPKDGS